MRLDPGTVLHDRYRIVRSIGSGGMGAVFEAIDARLQNTVAVKQTTAVHPEAARAFEREARILASLRHPALPVVIDYFSDQGGVFLVMQFIDGDDLSRLIRRLAGPCPAQDVLQWARTILDALAYLHGHQPPVIHRDIKPANLRRTPGGDIVLLDFGLAKTVHVSDTTVTTDRSLYGFTPPYAPPEQVDGRITDARSDIYALGATLYQLATGAAPARASERAGRVLAGAADPLVAPRQLNALIDETLSQVILRALALDPQDRFVSAIEMRDALFGRDEPLPRRQMVKLVGEARRIDAAMPSVVEVGRQTDLIVQVRFADSPLLGIEDWPTRRPPDHIEQGSETLLLVHPTDPRTGERLPARVCIKLAAPDFAVEGDPQRLIDVPPNDYSKRVAFLLTPQRGGFCRVNVEVFDSDTVYLGCIPVEVQAEAHATAAYTELRVANLVLQVYARRAGEATNLSAVLAHDPASPTRPEASPTSRAARPPVTAPDHLPLPRIAEESASPAPRRRKAPTRAIVYASLVIAAVTTAVLKLPLYPREAPVEMVSATKPAQPTDPAAGGQTSATPPPPPAPASTPRMSKEPALVGGAPLDPISAQRLVDPVPFDAVTADLNERARGILAQNAEWMRRWPSIHVTVEGHTDPQGERTNPLALGERRARTVRGYLVRLGIPASRLNVASRGGQAPVCRDETESCRSRNRRVLFIVTLK
jgi:serine/threonine protein kinase/outer membrane protein OmpA-like peptidoglycan-associated protein